MSKHLEAFHGINLHNNDVINFKPHQVSTLPASPFYGQTVLLDTIDGIYDANVTYQWNGTNWSTITHTDMTIAPGSADYLDITNHQLSIKQLAIGKVIVDETSTSLSEWITSSSYDGSQMQEGDILVLTSAAAGDKSYIHKAGSAGDATDFVKMFDEVTAAEVRGYFTDGEATTYNSADGSFDVGHDHSTININGSNELYVVDGAITTAKVADGNITEAKLSADLQDQLDDHWVGSIGNGTDSTFTITHGLGTRSLSIGIGDSSNNYKEISAAALDCQKPTVDTITLDFGSEVPTTDQYLVTIIGKK